MSYAVSPEETDIIRTKKWEGQNVMQHFFLFPVVPITAQTTLDGKI
jgi:hypothetical protein